MLKYTLSSVLIGLAGLAAAAAPLGTAHATSAFDLPEGQVTKFRVDYAGSLFILPIGELTVNGNLSRHGYSMRTDMRSSGFGKLSKGGDTMSTSLGFYNANGIRPHNHVIQKDNKKNRRVEIKYDAQGNPSTSIVPAFGSMGVPPATEQERREGVDAMSAILKLMMTGHSYGEAPCTGVLPVFDGKQRYDLRLEPAGAKTIRQKSYSGETVRCHIYMETVSGYDPEDLLTEEEASTPIEVYLANFEQAGLWVPVRFDYRISGIKVNIRATNIQVIAPQA